MHRILITGFSGFVSRHFCEYLEKNRIEAYILGIDIAHPKYDYSGYSYLTIEYKNIDLLDRGAVKAFIAENQPDMIVHLASYSSVAFSWKYPVESFVNNTNIFLNLAQAVVEAGVKCRILSVGSSEEYGNVSEEKLPLREEQILSPVSPYAVARVSQEMLSKIYVDNYGLDIVMTRSFNHIGPYQDTRFAIPSFIKQIMDTSETAHALKTGDISIVRDFVDVRDVVDAYYKLLLYGKKGEIYNICSGKGYTLDEIIQLIMELVGSHKVIIQDAAFIRKNDNRMIVGSYEKINKELGWKPSIEIEKTLRDMMEELKG